MTTAAKDGIPGLIVEAGGLGPAFSPETVADAAERLRNVLRRLGMLPGAVTDHGAMTFFSNFAWVNTTARRPVPRRGEMRPGVEERRRRRPLLRRARRGGRREQRARTTAIVLAISSWPVMPQRRDPGPYRPRPARGVKECQP